MKKIILFLFVTMAFYSCQTYTITPQSFKQQFATVDTTVQKKGYLGAPMYQYNYKANELKYIKVVDKSGLTNKLENSESLEMRVTLNNGKRYVMYFDTTILKNDTLYGGRSRILGGLTRKIPFDSIQKIEIQDGGKKHYSY